MSPQSFAQRQCLDGRVLVLLMPHRCWVKVAQLWRNATDRSRSASVCGRCCSAGGFRSQIKGVNNLAAIIRIDFAIETQAFGKIAHADIFPSVDGYHALDPALTCDLD